MPTFQPASPAGNMPGLAFSGGEGDAIIKMAPMLQQALEARMRMLAQGSENRTRASIANAGLQQRAEESANELAMRGQIAQASLAQDAMMQAAQQQHQMAMQEQEIQSRMQIMMLEPTQHARIQLERIRTADAEADRQVAANLITPETAAEWKAKARGIAGPLVRQQVMYDMAREQAQIARLQLQNKLATDVETQRQAFLLGNVDQLPLVTDPTTGRKMRMLLNHNGELYDPFAKSGGNEQDKQLEKAEKRWTDTFDRAIKYADERIEREIKAGDTTRAGGQSAWTDPAHRADAERIYRAKYMADHGLPATLAEVQSHFRGRGIGGSDAPVSGMGRPLVERKSFDVTKPETTEQKAFMGRLGEFDRQLKDSGLLNRNAREYQRIAQFIFEAAKVYSQAGSGAALSEDERKYIEANINQVEFELSKLRQQGTRSTPGFSGPSPITSQQDAMRRLGAPLGR
jgi:hypothetical protein